MQIGILEPDRFSPKALASLRSLGKVSCYSFGELPAFLQAQEVLFVRLAHRIDDVFLSMCPRLRWLCSPTTGHNHIDETELAARGITLLSLRGERHFLETIRATPEHTFGLILALLRRYNKAFSDVVAGLWDRDACRGEELYGNRVGIVGLGRVGYRVASYCSAFGAHVYWCDVEDVPSEPDWCRLPDVSSVIEKSRIVVLCAHHHSGQPPIFRQEEIDALSGRYFVNTARGELVDETALLDALRHDRLVGVAVDVIVDENGDSRLNEWRALLPVRNLIVTPHIGGATFDSMARTECYITDKLYAAIMGVRMASLTRQQTRTDLETQTGELFGSLWASLSDEHYRDSVELFTKRAIANQFDLDWLKGKKCLDAGCGSGSYSVALAMHGVDSVIAIDISERGLKEAEKRAKIFSQITFQQASVLDLPFDEATFDFVWSAGVIHHTLDFDRALGELIRVLRPGGKLFLLVYGAGGLRWKAIKAMRPVVADLGPEFVDTAIGLTALPANNRKHFMDDLFVPIQNLTKMNELQKKLTSLGITNVERWTGETYDHESNPDAQLENIQKLELIADSCITIAQTSLEKSLAALLKDIASLYVKATRAAINDSSLSPSEVRGIVIGESNLRVVATK